MKQEVAMKNVTQEQIDEAIKNCYWLSQNRQFSLIPDVCTGMCMPCKRVIERGECDTLIELFYGKGNKE